MKQVSTQAALQQGIEIMLPENGLTEKLQVAEREGRPLVVKLGFDPTAPDLHLGHAVVLRKLRQFQDAGHRIVVVIGDFTARIGDPTGKNKARPPLDEAQVQAHARTYTDQLSRILDMNRCDVCFNSSWLKDMGLERVIGLLSGTTLAQVLQRSDFQNRFRQQVPIVLHELMYPLLQGYDSLMIRADLEIGGTDQLFNCSMGRHLQESRGLPAQVVLCMPLLRGTDGSAKMSKSQGNTIGITEKPAVMFGKLMSVPDALLEEYLELASDFEPVQKTVLLQEAVTQPMQVKKILAENVTAQYHGVTAAAEARLFFEQQFQGRGFDDKAFEPVSLRSLGLEQGQELPLLDLCALLRPGDSRSVLRRLIEGGAVVLNGEKWREAGALVLLESLPLKIRLGRLHYFALA